MVAHRMMIRQHRTSGAALVEASLFIILLFIMLLGIVNVGRLYTTRIAMTNAAREGARWAAGNPTDNTGIAQSVMDEMKSAKLVPNNATLGTESTSNGVTTVPINVTTVLTTDVISATGVILYAGTQITNLAGVKIQTVADSVSTSGKKVKVGVAYGFRPYMGSLDRKSTRLNSSHIQKSRMPSSA